MNQWAISIIAGIVVFCVTVLFGYVQGEHHVQRKWDAAIAQAQMQAKAVEAQHLKDVNVIARQYTQEIHHVQAQSSRTIAALRSRTILLRDPYGLRLPCSAAGAPGSLAAPPGELSEQTSEFLVNFAAEADQVAVQLSACQQIIRDDRKVK